MKRKKLTALAAAVAVAASLTMPVSAASYVSGRINGAAYSGSVHTTVDTAVATTSYGKPGSFDVLATVYYAFGRGKYTHSTHASNTIGGATAVSHVQLEGAVVKGGKGKHNISSGGQKWQGTTTTGTTW